MVHEDWQWPGETAHAIAVHRPADVGAAPEAEPGEGEEAASPSRSSQPELFERHRQTRWVS